MGGQVTAPLFQLRDVSFDYEGIPALRDITLTVHAGERIALVGANGSGKSTLLRLFDALCFATSGTVEFAEAELNANQLRSNGFAHAFRRRVAMVFQNPDAQLFNPTVFDEVAFGPLQLKLSKPEVLERVNTALNQMGIAHLHERSPYRLSGGEKKKVALASVLVMDPEVLLLDEPTATLDPRTQSQLIDLIQGWKSTKKTVITATHQLEIVEDIADRVVVLQEGRIAAEGSPVEILGNSELLLSANLVHAHRHTHGGVVHSHPHVHTHSHREHEH